MHLLARERVRARERRFGPARVPVVAVGDEQRVVAARLAAVELDRPDAVLVACGVLDAGLEGDLLAQAEVVDVVVEVGRDLRVVGEVRIGLRHREVRVLHARARGVDEQVAVGGRHAVAVSEHPVAADAVGLLEAVERDPALVQRLGGRDPRGAGADHAHARGARRRTIAFSEIAMRPIRRRCPGPTCCGGPSGPSSASAWPARPSSCGASAPRRRRRCGAPAR